MWAVEHWNAEPDMILMAKALSGGFVPVGAVGMRKDMFDKLFSSMVRAPVHGSTFSKNNLAMAAGIATLRVLQRREPRRARGEARRVTHRATCAR